MIKELIAKLRKPKPPSPPPSPATTGFCWYRVEQARESRALIYVLDRQGRQVSQYWTWLN